MTQEDQVWLSGQFDSLRKELTAGLLSSEHRLTALESWRTAEVAASVSRGTWAGIIAAAGLTGLIEVWKTWFHK